MSFDYNMDDVVSLFNLRKDNIKRRMIGCGFEVNKDYIIEKRQNGKSERKETRGGGRNREHIMMTKRCYDQLIVTLKLTTKTEINTDNINICYVKRFLPAETEILDFIYDMLKPTINVKKQYIVDRYRIDLYIVDKKIAIECDEDNHRYYDKSKETKREKFIQDILNCTFVRFNPFDKDFKLSKLLATIVGLLL